MPVSLDFVVFNHCELLIPDYKQMMSANNPALIEAVYHKWIDFTAGLVNKKYAERKNSVFWHFWVALRKSKYASDHVERSVCPKATL